MNRELTLRGKGAAAHPDRARDGARLLQAPLRAGQRPHRACREDTAQEQLALEQNAVRLAQMEKMEQALADIRAAGGSKAIPRFNNSEALLRELRGLLTGTGNTPRFRRRHDAAGLYRPAPRLHDLPHGTYEQSRAIIDRLSASDNINRISDLSIRRDERSGGQGLSDHADGDLFRGRAVTHRGAERHENNRANRHNDRGFTLSEVLLTVAILVVLFALAAVPVSKMRRELRQTELDSKAEILFQTAQNRMTQLLAAGMEEKYKNGGDVKRFTYIPLDAEEDKYDETDIDRLPLWYVTDAEKDNDSAAAYYILPREQTDAELREGHWLVEYNADSGSVYAVFYSEEALGVHTGLDVLRYRSQRVKTAKVGYYGGDAAAVNDTGVLAPRAEILNGGDAGGAHHLQGAE